MREGAGGAEEPGQRGDPVLRADAGVVGFEGGDEGGDGAEGGVREGGGCEDGG